MTDPLAAIDATLAALSQQLAKARDTDAFRIVRRKIDAALDERLRLAPIVAATQASTKPSRSKRPKTTRV